MATIKMTDITVVTAKARLGRTRLGKMASLQLDKPVLGENQVLIADFEDETSLLAAFPQLLDSSTIKDIRSWYGRVIGKSVTVELKAFKAAKGDKIVAENGKTYDVKNGGVYHNVQAILFDGKELDAIDNKRLVEARINSYGVTAKTVSLAERPELADIDI